MNNHGGSPLAPTLELVNTLATDLQAWLDTNQPGRNIMLSTWCYLDLLGTPTNLPLADNVIIRVCNALYGCNTSAGCIGHEGALSHPMTLNQNLQFGRKLPAWTGLHDHVYIWDYNINQLIPTGCQSKSGYGGGA